MTEGRLPSTASVVHQLDAARLHAPAAERNVRAILSYLGGVVPASGTALELASGTGQHIVSFARTFPSLAWLPTEVAEDRLRSISAYVADAGLSNLEPPTTLDATRPGWGEGHAVDLVVLINLLHLVSAKEAHIVVDEAARALTPTGAFVLYGPFKRAGRLTSDGDRAFHASLTTSDPRIGYKDVETVTAWMHKAGLRTTITEMPANNLAICARPV